jgi:hypothetical protein
MALRQAAALATLASAALAVPPQFKTHTIATDLKGGYQVVVHDVNRDGKPDLIALASGFTELLWFENPTWKRHVLAANLRRMINVAACPGVDQLLVAHEFANVPKNSIGVVSVLEPGADRSQPWTAREIDRITTAHRIRCADIDGSGKPVFINAPLAGAKADAPDYRDQVPLVYYRPGEWKRHFIGDQNQGVMHGIFINRFAGGTRDHVLTASFSGIHDYWLDKKGTWRRAEVTRADPAPAPKGGSSDIAIGYLRGVRFLASIEPWHGNQVVVYTKRRGQWVRNVIDDSLVDGHTLAIADFDGDGAHEIVAGYRGMGRSVHIYQTLDKKRQRWFRTPLDQGGMAAAACATADLNADGRPDVACIGSATTNLKWYENLGAQ